MSIFKKKKVEQKPKTMGEHLVELVEIQPIGDSFERVSKRLKRIVKKEEHEKLERLLSALGYHCLVPESPDSKNLALQKNLWELKELRRELNDELNVDASFRETLCHIAETGKG